MRVQPPQVSFRVEPARHARLVGHHEDVDSLYAAERKPAPVIKAACWSHGRREFFDLARLGKSPISAEIVRRIDEVFGIEREINDASVDMRLAARQERSKPLVADLKVFMHAGGK